MSELAKLLGVDMESTMARYDVAPKQKKVVHEKGQDICLDSGITFYISDDKFPVIRGWNLDDEYTLLVKVKPVSLSKDSYDNKNRTNATLQIQEIVVAEKESDEGKHEEKEETNEKEEEASDVLKAYAEE